MTDQSRTTPARQRTVTWDDPMITAEAARQTSGLKLLQSIARGELPGPPIAALLGFGLIEIERGRALLEYRPDESHYNPIGTVHGGVFSTVLDSAMALAVHSMLDAGSGFTTTELKVNFVRGVHADTGRLLAQGQVIHGGRRTMLAEARLVDDSDKLFAHSTSSCLILGG